MTMQALVLRAPETVAQVTQTVQEEVVVGGAGAQPATIRVAVGALQIPVPSYALPGRMT